jgi:2,3-bisphosphoglycerate-independent phosphoglycerate mutase
MVGHTGVMDAAIKACEAVDSCVEAVITTALNHNYTTLLIADHGNCETMINSDGSPNTAHTTNPVPIILIDNELTNIKNGVLADIAPTILKLVGIEKPEVMTQNSLI